MSKRRSPDDAGGRGRSGRRLEHWIEQLEEKEVPYNVCAKCKIEALRCQLVNGWERDACVEVQDVQLFLAAVKESSC